MAAITNILKPKSSHGLPGEAHIVGKFNLRSIELNLPLVRSVLISTTTHYSYHHFPRRVSPESS